MLFQRSVVHAFLLILLVFAQKGLLGNTNHDLERIKKTSDLESCFSVFNTILDEQEKKHPKNKSQEYLKARKDLSRAMDKWRQANNPDSWDTSFFKIYNKSNKDLSVATWGAYPQFCRAYSLINGIAVPLNSEFEKDGFIVSKIDGALLQSFMKEFYTAKKIPFVVDDSDPNYTATIMDGKVEEKLNDLNTYFMFEERHLRAVEPILLSLKEEIAACYGTPWKVTSIRAWETPHCESAENPTGVWHTDGYPEKSLKILMYLSGASKDIGSTTLQTPNGNYTVSGEPGTWLLFKNSELTHRAEKPQSKTRLLLEINIAPSISYELSAICAGTNARHPILPWQSPIWADQPQYTDPNIVGVNIGGEPNWKSKQWINLTIGSAVTKSGANHRSFQLFPNCRLPLKDESVGVVYSSHVLERLSTPCVYQVLSQAHRVLKEGGSLIIKIPDSEKALDSWKKGDKEFLSREQDIDPTTWASCGVCDCLDHRASMAFCSFYNIDPLKAETIADAQEKHPIPAISEAKLLSSLAQSHTPSQIAWELRKLIRCSHPLAPLYRQSAWSREEIAAVLKSFGFEVVTFDSEKIFNFSFESIPGIQDMKDRSMYCWATKRSINTY